MKNSIIHLTGRNILIILLFSILYNYLTYIVLPLKLAILYLLLNIKSHNLQLRNLTLE